MTTSRAILVADLGYGDAGKGSIVDYLTRLHKAHTVVMYTGGAQAAHNVVTPDGKHHTFAQFGSGMFVPGTRSHAAHLKMVNPLSMINEERHLRSLGITDAFERSTIDERCIITTPFHQAANRLREMFRGGARHGSCGMGIGETMSDFVTYGNQVLLAGDLSDEAKTRKKLKFLQELKLAQLQKVIQDIERTEPVLKELEILQGAEVIDYCVEVYKAFTQKVKVVGAEFVKALINQPGTVLFEGAQGVLLDEWYGFHPYTTWSTISFANALATLGEVGFTGEVTKLGLARAYATRHGAGPFVTEDTKLSAEIPDHHNANNAWQREFRVGYFDAVATRYAIEVCGRVDYLAVTNLDRYEPVPVWKIATSYSLPNVGVSELAKYFDLEKGELKGIKKVAHPDLAHQEVLTNLLWKCTPNYEEVSKEDYMSILVQRVGVPVAITSHGMTSADKKLTELWKV